MTHFLCWLSMAALLPFSSLAAPRERTLVVAGDSPAVVHVAADQPTVLTFEVAPLAGGTRVEGRAAVPVLVTAQGIVLFPARDVSVNDASVLVAQLSDGSSLRFQLVTVPEVVDERVRVRRSLEGATPGELRARLERCEQGRDRLEAMAAFLAEHAVTEELVLSRKAAEGKWKLLDTPVIFIRMVEDRASGVAFAVFEVQSVSALVLRPQVVGASGRELRLLRAFPGSLAIEANRLTRIVLAIEASEEAPAHARFTTPEGVSLEAPIVLGAAHPRGDVVQSK